MLGLWFAKIERDVIARGVFTSMPDLGTQPPPLHKRLFGERAADSFGNTQTSPAASVVTILLHRPLGR